MRFFGSVNRKQNFGGSRLRENHEAGVREREKESS